MFAKRMLIIVPWMLSIFAVAGMVIMVLTLLTPKASCIKNVYYGNEYVTANDFYKAADCFHDSIVLEPKNAELQKHIIDTLIKAKESLSLDEYTSFVDYLYKKCPIDDVGVEKNNLLIENTMELLAEDKYEEAIITAEKIEVPQNTSDMKEFYRNIYLKLSQISIDNKDFENAFSMLFKAVDLSEEKEKYKEEVYELSAACIRFLEDAQRYDDALTVIDKVESYYELNDSLAKNKERLVSHQEFYNSVLNEIDSLNEVYKSDSNNDALIEQHIYKLYQLGSFRYDVYCSSLMLKDETDSSDKPDGSGVAAYWKDNTLYVFYGEFEAGIKNGEGTLHEVKSTRYIKSYSGEWNNNVPEGKVTTTEDITIEDPADKESTIACDLVMEGNVLKGIYEGEWDGKTYLRGTAVGNGNNYSGTYKAGYASSKGLLTSINERYVVPGKTTFINEKDGTLQPEID